MVGNDEVTQQGHTAQLMPLPLTVACFSKIQTGLLVRPSYIRITPYPCPQLGEAAESRYLVKETGNEKKLGRHMRPDGQSE